MLRTKVVFKDFIKNFLSAGVLLILVTIVSLLLANGHSGATYLSFFDQHFGFGKGNVQINLSLTEWINDGLMALFFLLVGLEIKRELIVGELATRRKAMLPFFAAIGGMVVPASIYLIFNMGTSAQSGWGIPMATDIAFALAVLAMAGKWVPLPLKIFLTALAIIDDLGAILVIVFFYSHGLQINFLLYALVPVAGLYILNKFNRNNLILYLAFGLILWYCILKSGVHATISGVILSMFIPLRKSSEKVSSLERLEHSLQPIVNFIILPVFAMANTALLINTEMLSKLSAALPLGILLGLILGKPLGITVFSWMAVKMKWASLPGNISWRLLSAASILGGIGFTMSIFISMLAFQNHYQQDLSKIAVLIASFISGLTGFAVLKFIQAKNKAASRRPQAVSI